MGEVEETPPVRYKRIPLSNIVLEDDFRKTVDDPILALSTLKRGLEDFLVVEDTDEGLKYVLVHGYLRFQALVNAGFRDAMCSVEVYTNSAERIIKRLRKEFHSHKRTGYELEKMIQALRASGISEQEIALKTDVTISTVKKYLKTKDIDANLRSLAEQHGASRDGLTKIWSLPKSVKQNVKESLLFRVATKDGITGNDADSVVKMAKVSQFGELSESAQEQCFNRAIDTAGFSTRDAKAIVYEHFIRSGYDPEVHRFLYDKMCEQLESVRVMKLTPFFYDHLTLEQRKHLNDLGIAALVPVSPPLKWNYFPGGHPLEDKDEHHPFN
ncbi:MAG: ParB-like nuclease protein [Bacilli bacterium]|nr:ParB-like nuclease protein [Bacilli bacterium]